MPARNSGGTWPNWVRRPAQPLFEWNESFHRIDRDMKPIDPLQLQRLVDGELDDKQVQRILIDAKAEPDHWRDIAVGFVESQTWSRAFMDEGAENVDPVFASINSAGSMKPADSIESVSSKPTDSHHSSSFSWLVMAASLLAAATIGYMVNQIQNRNLPTVPIADNDNQAITEPLIADNSVNNVQPKMTPADYRPADYHLEVPEEHLGDLVSAGPVPPVPLYTVNNAEQLNQFSQQRTPPALPPEVLEQLSGSGYQMEQAVSFISGRLDDGRSFVVPVRTIEFVPGQ